MIRTPSSLYITATEWRSPPPAVGEEKAMSDVHAPRMRGAISVKEFCHWASIGRTAAYEEIARGRLRARKAGKRTLIPMSEAQRWLDALPTHEIQLDQRDGKSIHVG